jgi:hypothetical protein
LSRIPEALRTVKGKFIIFFLILCVTLGIVPFLKYPYSIFAPSNCKSTTNAYTAMEERNLQLWKSYITKLSTQDLWISRDAADASEILMVPMHYAFISGYEDGIRDFSYLMSRFAHNELPGGQLNQASWLYFVSQYLLLKARYGFALGPDDLSLLYRTENWTLDALYAAPDFQWESLPYLGVVSRLQSLAERSVKKIEPSYYSAVGDYELFVMAIAADLLNINDCIPMGIKLEKSGVQKIQSALNIGMSVVLPRWQKLDSGALFQVGVWKDHGEYIYAGNNNLDVDIEPIKVDNISEDSSHSHRWPLWLQSFSFLSHLSSSKKLELAELIELNSNQFRNVVVSFSSQELLLNNFMDGSNGVYRFRYTTVGRNAYSGYGPYMLSGILGSSWYPFSCESIEVFKKYASSYPLSRSTVKTYTGPNTSRVRNPSFEWPNFFLSGFAEMIANQSLTISKTYKKCTSRSG